MLIVMKPTATAKEISGVVARITSSGCEPHISENGERTLIGIVGSGSTALTEDDFDRIEGVEQVMRVSAPYKRASRKFHPADTVIPLNGVKVGSKQVAIIAGPCSVESREQIIETACAVKEAGAVALRGGAFKPRSSPYSFQGHGEQGLEWLAEARSVTGLSIVTEVLDTGLVPLVAKFADVLQIGARNMQNFALLHAVGSSQHPVLLKRGLSSTMEELLMAAEYVMSHGNTRVMLCERGIRTFETYTRNTFDVNAIPVLKSLTHLPVIADPSHAVGKWEYVEAVARSAVAAGADGLIVEVHMHPDKALSDGRQSLTPERFGALVQQVKRIAEAVDRSA
jgi:3-deoxy-7-phosphoheptulonate synthase